MLREETLCISTSVRSQYRRPTLLYRPRERSMVWIALTYIDN
jgi:hypothetical protein